MKPSRGYIVEGCALLSLVASTGVFFTLLMAFA